MTNKRLKKRDGSLCWVLNNINNNNNFNINTEGRSNTEWQTIPQFRAMLKMLVHVWILNGKQGLANRSEGAGGAIWG